MTSANERRVRCAANAIAWELYANDGRATFNLTDGDTGTSSLAAYMNKAETEEVLRIARRVVRDLAEMERNTDKEAPPA